MQLKKTNLSKKALVLFAFSIILLIPLFFINNIIDERSHLYNTSSKEIGNSWGKAQTIAGPVVTIPYTTVYYKDKVVTDKNGKEAIIKQKDYEHHYAIFTPEVYISKINIKDSIRNRGIYKSIVYTADVELTGYFNIADFSKIDSTVVDSITWDKSAISLALTDTRAIIDIKKFKIGNENISIKSGVDYSVKGYSKFENGGSSMISLKGNTPKLPFTITLEIKGSNSFSIVPIGDSNDIKITSTWKEPSFKGILPTNRDINNVGFIANWNLTNLSLNLNKDFSTRVDNNSYDSYDSKSITVELYQGVTHYRQVIRATKYAYLFIALSLLVLFIFEVVGKRSIHFLQYSIIGVSLAVFYLVLLALSERIPFLIAYLISALTIVVPISLYTVSFLKNKRYGIGICVTLSGLYLVLLSILQLEDYALLTGTGLILVTLYALMYLTRHLKVENEDDKVDGK